jgi:hypothetical protein
MSFILNSYCMTNAIPGQANQFQVGINEVAFMYRLEKLVEKLIKLDKSSNKEKMYDLIIDIKSEIETSCGLSFNLSKCIDEIERLIKNSGVKPPKELFVSIRKSLKNKEKKSNHHAHYLAATMHMQNYQFDEHDEQMLYTAKHGHEKDDDEEKKQEVDVPAQLVFGVTLALCGLFLMVIPIPACKPWGERLVQSGVLICGNCICGKSEDDKKKDKDKNKK